MCRRDDYPPYQDIDHHALDRERKRLAKDQDKRMHGDRRTQHVLNGIIKKLRRAT